MIVAGIGLDASNRTPIVLLRDSSGRRQVPIWIDHAQASNILAGIQGLESKRPLSHDLMITLLEAGNLKLNRVIIHSIESNSFQAVLKVRKVSKTKEKVKQITNEEIIDIESRPSDAIALALRAKCSIWMLEEVVSEASIPVDVNADIADQNEFRKFLEDVSPSKIIKHLDNRNQ